MKNILIRYAGDHLKSPQESANAVQLEQLSSFFYIHIASCSKNAIIGLWARKAIQEGLHAPFLSKTSRILLLEN